MFRRILIPVDISHPKELSILLESALKNSVGVDETLFNFLYVDESRIHSASYPYVDPDDEDIRRQNIKDSFRSLVTSMVPETCQYRCQVRRGVVHEQILKEAEKTQAEAIIMMAHKSSLDRFLAGSNSEQVACHAKCSVLVLRERRPTA